jgi:hypothetical protein
MSEDDVEKGRRKTTLAPSYAVVTASVHVACPCGQQFILTSSAVNEADRIVHGQMCMRCGRRLEVMVTAPDVYYYDPPPDFVSHFEPEPLPAPIRRDKWQ